MPRPTRSLAVVIKGPEASAGFIPAFSRISGINVPRKDAITTTENNATETTIES